MKRLLQYCTFTLFFLFSSLISTAQLTLQDIQYWVGSGTDSSVLVVDFQDATWDTSYVWGYLHDGTATGEDMLNAIAAADVNFAANISGGFLNDITYGSHVGIGGTGGFFWGTWSGTSIASMTANAGISEALSNGDWFGCSYTDFNPALPPGEPIPAFDPFRFTLSDVEFVVGTGTDTSILVIDFLTSTGVSSYAWGYAYSGTATGEDMLNDIAAADPNLEVAIGAGFLNDITYGGLAGIGGSPDFWGTWSASNLGTWDFNIGIGQELENGGYFGCSYTDFNPALRPSYPEAATTTTFFTIPHVQYYIGSGSDTSLLVVDFNDGTWDESYAWGYIHDGTATAEDMLNDIAAADPNFEVAIGAGFLNDIIYGTHTGIGGTGGFFWSTWSGTGALNFTLNAGISEVLSNGDWFGCSFTDFNPALAPSNPIPAFDPLRFTSQDVEFWVGTGTDSSILVIDFITSTGVSSYAWGYAYSGNATGEDMLNDIAAADPNLEVAIGAGFLNDITYGGLAGIGGNPNFWGTWSATNLGTWDFNIGIGQALENGSYFGCSYTDFNPALRPSYPEAATTTRFFTLPEVRYYIGSGSDTSLLVVDFNDGSWDESYAWGYIHDGTATAEDMLNAIAAADLNFSVSIGSGFLNDITYGKHAGIGGTGGFFWSTWSGTGALNLTLNAGISEILSDGDWFGCSFTDFNPALAPSNPIPAFDPLRFTSQDVEFWVGTGTDSSILVIDFITGTDVSSFAWGYVYSGIATGEDMLNDIAAADPNLDVAIGAGFLNDITYENLSGIGGNPNFWGTWSATNLGTWDFNIGIGDTLTNGSFFGCSYTDFNPALRPDYPEAAPFVTSVTAQPESDLQFTIYPNPTTDWLTLDFQELYTEKNQVRIIDAKGSVMWHGTNIDSITPIPVSPFSPGLYRVLVFTGSSLHAKTFVKP